jgi:hypothetical protein
MGHMTPDAEWFEKGLIALDEPLTPPGKLYEQAGKLLEQKKLGEALLAYSRAATRGAGEPFAEGAEKKASELLGGLDDAAADVAKLIHAGNIPQAAKANTALRARYGPFAERQFREFEGQIKDARSPTGK